MGLEQEASGMTLGREDSDTELLNRAAGPHGSPTKRGVIRCNSQITITDNKVQQVYQRPNSAVRRLPMEPADDGASDLGSPRCSVGSVDSSRGSFTNPFKAAGARRKQDRAEMMIQMLKLSPAAAQRLRKLPRTNSITTSPALSRQNSELPGTGGSQHSSGAQSPVDRGSRATVSNMAEIRNLTAQVRNASGASFTGKDRPLRYSESGTGPVRSGNDGPTPVRPGSAVANRPARQSYSGAIVTAAPEPVVAQDRPSPTRVSANSPSPSGAGSILERKPAPPAPPPQPQPMPQVASALMQIAGVTGAAQPRLLARPPSAGPQGPAGTQKRPWSGVPAHRASHTGATAAADSSLAPPATTSPHNSNTSHTRNTPQAGSSPILTSYTAVGSSSAGAPRTYFPISPAAADSSGTSSPSRQLQSPDDSRKVTPSTSQAGFVLRRTHTPTSSLLEQAVMNLDPYINPPPRSPLPAQGIVRVVRHTADSQILPDDSSCGDSGKLPLHGQVARTMGTARTHAFSDDPCTLEHSARPHSQRHGDAGPRRRGQALQTMKSSYTVDYELSESEPESEAEEDAQLWKEVRKVATEAVQHSIASSASSSDSGATAQTAASSRPASAQQGLQVALPAQVETERPSAVRFKMPPSKPMPQPEPDLCASPVRLIGRYANMDRSSSPSTAPQQLAAILQPSPPAHMPAPPPLGSPGAFQRHSHGGGAGSPLAAGERPSRASPSGQYSPVQAARRLTAGGTLVSNPASRATSYAGIGELPDTPLSPGSQAGSSRQDALGSDETPVSRLGMQRPPLAPGLGSAAPGGSAGVRAAVAARQARMSGAGTQGGLTEDPPPVPRGVVLRISSDGRSLEPVPQAAKASEPALPATRIRTRPADVDVATASASGAPSPARDKEGERFASVAALAAAGKKPPAPSKGPLRPSSAVSRPDTLTSKALSTSFKQGVLETVPQRKSMDGSAAGALSVSPRKDTGLSVVPDFLKRFFKS